MEMQIIQYSIRYLNGNKRNFNFIFVILVDDLVFYLFTDDFVLGKARFPMFKCLHATGLNSAAILRTKILK